MASNDPLPARVSDEDREAAITIVNAAFDSWTNQSFKVWPGDTPLADVMLDALAAHGWGPQARVDPTKLGEFIDAANAGGMAVPWRGLQDYLRECGIEVTE